MRTLFLIITTLGFCLAISANHSNLKIYGGKTAEPGQFPFIVSINATEFEEEWCAGSIINENWILTTATCTEFEKWLPEQLIVISGTNQLDSGGVSSKVNQVVVHPNFTVSNFEQNNIALFKIEDPLVFSDLVQPVELGEVPADVSATVVGWGYTEIEDNPALQYADVSVWTNEDCTAVAGGRVIGEGEVCAFGGAGVGLCGGDVGAPLVFNGAVVGIGSLTMNACGGGQPDVYTRVGYFLDWINGVVGGKY